MTVHHDVRGDGPPVLLVHAGIADSRMWAGVAAQLAPTHRVVTCDLRGFGRTPLPPERFSHSGDLIALLDELGIERAAVVGASMGGHVALELAAVAPERVTALALLGASIDEFDRSGELAAFGEAENAALEAGDVEAAVAVNVRMWVARPGARPPEDVDPAACALVADMQRDAFVAQLAAGDVEEDELDPPVSRRLSEIRVPALVAVGADDVEDFHRLARRLAEELPGARPPVTIPGAAHLPALERPAETAALLLDFLAEVEAAPGPH